MGIITTLLGWGKSAWNFLTGLPGDIGNALSALWHFIASVHQVLDYAFSHPLTELLNVEAFLAGLVTDNQVAMLNALMRIDPWIVRHRVLPLRQQVLLWFAQLRARIAYLFAQAYLYINLKFREAEAYTRQLVTAEHNSMLLHFKEAEQYAFAQALARYQAIEHEAASAYNAGLDDRLGLAGRLADLIATRNPAVRGLVRAITTGLVDLAGVENPLARLALGFVIRQLIDRLAVDKPVADLLNDILGPILGRPRSRGVPDTVADLEARLRAVESWQAAFMADGGPEILQAGEGWAELTSLIVDAGLLGFMAETIVDPPAAARQAADIILPVADAARAAWTGLLRA